MPVNCAAATLHFTCCTQYPASIMPRMLALVNRPLCPSTFFSFNLRAFLTVGSFFLHFFGITSPARGYPLPDSYGYVSLAQNVIKHVRWTPGQDLSSVIHLLNASMSACNLCRVSFAAIITSEVATRRCRPSPPMHMQSWHCSQTDHMFQHRFCTVPLCQPAPHSNNKATTKLVL